jgi:hypothetical protein
MYRSIGAQRCRCNNTDCPRPIFLFQYRNHACLPAVKQQMVDMALNRAGLQQDNEGLLQYITVEQVQGIDHKVEAADAEEMCSFVGSKSQQRRLWHVIDHFLEQEEGTSGSILIHVTT